MVELNAAALHELTLAVLPGMVERGAGAVLNVASLAAFQPLPRMATYAATKAFVQSFSEAAHEELAGTGVSVTALCPGATRTAFFAADGAEGATWLQRLGMPEAGPVAEAGWWGMKEGRRVVVPGARNKLSALMPRLVPRALSTAVTGRLLARRG